MCQGRVAWANPLFSDKQFHLQLKSEQKEIIQNVLERKDSMAVLPTGFGKSMWYVSRGGFKGDSKMKVNMAK
jgi:superfamily II DNA or RNA helicase